MSHVFFRHQKSRDFEMLCQLIVSRFHSKIRSAKIFIQNSLEDNKKRHYKKKSANQSLFCQVHSTVPSHMARYIQGWVCAKQKLYDFEVWSLVIWYAVSFVFYVKLVRLCKIERLSRKSNCVLQNAWCS